MGTGSPRWRNGKEALPVPTRSGPWAYGIPRDDVSDDDQRPVERLEFTPAWREFCYKPLVTVMDEPGEGFRRGSCIGDTKRGVAEKNLTKI